MKKIFLLLSLVVVVAFVVLMININEKQTLQKQEQIHDNINKILFDTIDNEKNPSLALAIALGNSRAIQDVVMENNRTLGYRVLEASARSLKQHASTKDIYIQIFTKDLKIFARSWESSLPTIPLITGRKANLRELIKNQKPKTGIDVGLPLGIKSSSMITYKNKFLGLLEVTTLYDDIVSKIREYKIEIIPLININLVPRIYIEQKKLFTLGENYVVANENANLDLINRLKSLTDDELIELMQNDFLQSGTLFFASYPLRNVNGIRLGTFIAIIDKENFENLIGEQKSIFRSIYSLDSTPTDTYNYVKRQDENIFLGLNRENVPVFKDLVDEKDRLDFDEAARTLLGEFSKEELIELILHNRDKKVIQGEIR